MNTSPEQNVIVSFSGQITLNRQVLADLLRDLTLHCGCEPERQLVLEKQAPREPLLMRVKDAALLLGVHRATIWRLVKAGRLQAVELLGSLRLRRADVEALASGNPEWR